MQPITDPSIVEGYLTDASNIHGHAEGLVRPRNAAEVAEIVAHCQAHGIPLTVTAGRTSTTGAPVPFGGWVLSTEHLDRIVSIDQDTAVAGAGIYLGAFQDEVERAGRFFPPDPTSRHECTLGAAVACNASGARSFRYGPTRPWVLGLEVVLPTGEIRRFHRGDPVPAEWPVPAWTEPAVKTAAGYAPPVDAVDLFIGQEGTLGVITEVTVKLTELPEQVLGVLAFFPDRQSAVAFVEVARDAARRDPKGALSPRCLEYLDAACVELARERVGDVPEGAGAALFCEQEVSVDEEDHLEAWWEALLDAGALADDTVVTTTDEGREKLHAFRHAVPAGINERVVANGMPKVGTDLAVPDACLSEIMDLYEAVTLDNVLFGHIGDNHLHLNFLPKNDEELARAKAEYAALARKAVAMGGTVSAEHGIGKIKREYLAMMVDEPVLAQFRALKRTLDPACILGRGTLFQPEGEQAR